MRTKTLLLTAALSAAGVATSMAQAVYSVNAVGYVNTSIEPGFNLIANPLDAADNTIASVFAGVPNGTAIFLLAEDGTFHPTLTYIGAPLNRWQGDEALLADPVEPGEGLFIRNPTEAAFTVTFVGEVPQGAASNKQIPAGLSIQASPVPQAGTLVDLEFPAANGDAVFIYNEETQGYDQTYTYIGAPLNRWNPEAPSVNVGEAFFVRKAAPADWNRDFNINE